MRWSTLPLFALLTACAAKAPAPEAATPVASAPAAAPAPVAAPAPAPAPPARTPNIDLQATLVMGDGSEVKGHVIRVERSEDWYADKGWTDKPLKLTVTLAQGDTEVEVPWTDIRAVDIRFGGPQDVNCSFDGSSDPVLWMCELTTTTTVTTADGKKRQAAGRHKWRFTFEDGRQQEFWIYKIPLKRQQREGESVDDNRLQIALRDELLAMREGRVPTRIVIAP